MDEARARGTPLKSGAAAMAGAAAAARFDARGAGARTDGRNEGLGKGVVGEAQQQACAGEAREARRGATRRARDARQLPRNDRRRPSLPPSARVLRLRFLFSPGPLLTALAHAAVANQHQLEQVVVVALRLRGEGARGEQRGGGPHARAAAPAERAR
jgi:hypothetical protein